MGRKPRFELRNAFWHIHTRGVAGCNIFVDDHDRREFLAILRHVIVGAEWLVPSFTQMTTHYHALIFTPEPTLSDGVNILNGEYARYHNRRHRRYGHLFSERFRPHLVEEETYLLRVARYIILNAVRAGMVRHPSDWKWSTYRMTAGLDPPSAMFDTRLLLARFGDDVTRAMAQYREFVDAQPMERSLWREVRNQIYLGSEAFVERTERRLEELRRASTMVPGLVEGDSALKVVEEIFGANPTIKSAPNHFARCAYAWLMRSERCFTFPRIAKDLTVSEPTARRLAATGRLLRYNDISFRKRLFVARQILRSLPTNA